MGRAEGGMQKCMGVLALEGEGSWNKALTAAMGAGTVCRALHPSFMKRFTTSMNGAGSKTA